LGRLKRINSEPVLGTWDGADSVAFQFADTDVSPGQIYWYWVQDSETGDLYGPVAGTLPGIGNTPGMAVRAFLPTMVN
jgi:hypothetical protein